ncbi:MMtag domain-containing protein [Sporobolomyces koalae]|uniref:MMtag domain-containing protein n=1 Tax=Sporobolomyces koalae TaxID=500713 RepID=UPI00317719AF
MFHPTRGGTRGGQGDFKWTDVAADKDREYYLGHSLNAPVGRWQNGKDLTWYQKDKDRDLDEEERIRQEEIAKVKQAEEDALAVALGFAPTVRNPNDIPTSGTKMNCPPQVDSNEAILAKAKHRAEKEARKAERDAKRRERESKRRDHGRERDSRRDRERDQSPRRSRDERDRRDDTARQHRSYDDDRDRGRDRRDEDRRDYRRETR